MCRWHDCVAHGSRTLFIFPHHLQQIKCGIAATMFLDSWFVRDHHPHRINIDYKVWLLGRKCFCMFSALLYIQLQFRVCLSVQHHGLQLLAIVCSVLCRLTRAVPSKCRKTCRAVCGRTAFVSVRLFEMRKMAVALAVGLVSSFAIDFVAHSYVLRARCGTHTHTLLYSIIQLP